jgi:HrpA-like RNA helicase
MILAAREQGCLREVLIIAAALSVQDPRDRPQEHAGAADQAHAKWKDEKSRIPFLPEALGFHDELLEARSPRTSSARVPRRTSSTGCAARVARRAWAAA